MSNDRKYISPSIKLINGTNEKIWFLLWLSSRQEILKLENGDRMYLNLSIEDLDYAFEDLPDKFYVGDELVEKANYADRIAGMNLQYMNFPYYIFEIQGSCLFRDIIFNINKVAQWAVSNRFLFSILGSKAVFDPQNYPISEEYRYITAWEEQFDKYMKAIRDDQVVDHNRVEMPYSITSKFYIGINRKTLMDFLKFLKFHAPFFYNVYGKLFISELGMVDNDIKDGNVSAAITQYINKSKNTWNEDVYNVSDTYVVESKMGLILYSQFIRQADTTIKGLFDEIIHNDPDKFKNKVFKGGTILNTHYVADYDKIKSTLSTRLCAFAMSSGNDPCSWSYFLNNFLPDDLTPEKLMDLLPCKFKNDKLVHCKFHDDVKFRNEGKEVSNCPCPLVTLSLEHALKKKERDNNKIGDAYYELTNYLINNGMPYTANYKVWTSDLFIKSSKKLTDDCQFDNVIQRIAEYIGKHVSTKYGKYEDPENWFDKNYYDKYSLDGDNTCMMKGFAIDEIYKYMESTGHTKYLISFGGDMFIRNANVLIPIQGTKYKVKLNGTYSVFTSGNTDKRGNHIIGGGPGTTTSIVTWTNFDKIDNTLIDALTTKLHAKETELALKAIKDVSGLVSTIRINEDKMITNPTYCASPFFNPEQIEIRDNMVSQFTNGFRPDLTESSKKYDMGNSSFEVVKAVVDENHYGIKSSDCLVFPMRTIDLGTLFEVGYALGTLKTIITYDEVKDEYVIHPPMFVSLKKVGNYFAGESNKYLFDCSKKRDVIALGTASLSEDNKNIYYELKGCPDNIMLSVYYNHVEMNENGEYVKIERNLDERDQ